MRRSRVLGAAAMAVAALVCALPASATQAPVAAKPGALCRAPGSTRIVAGAKFTCAPLRGRLAWVTTGLPHTRLVANSDGLLGFVDKTWRSRAWAKYYGEGLGYKDAYVRQGSTFHLTWRVTTAGGLPMANQAVSLLANKAWSASNATFINDGGLLVRKTVDGHTSAEFAGRTDARGLVTFTLTDRSLQSEPADTPVDAVDRLIQETGAVYGQFALRLGTLADTGMAMDLVDVHILAEPKPDDPAAFAANLPIGPLLWADEFVGGAGSQPDTANWTARYCGHTDANGGGTCWNNESQYYVPEAVALDGSASGAAVITTTHVAAPPPTGTCYGTTCAFTSARFDTMGKVAFQYGFIEARIAMPKGGGNWPAFWMLGAAGTAGKLSPGEIDIVEGAGAWPAFASGSIHFPIAPDAAGAPRQFHGSGSSTGTDTTSGFHTYAIAWLPDEIHFYIDGRQFFTASNLVEQNPFWAFNAPFFLILNNAVSPDNGMGGPYSGWDSSQMRIDYVRQYQLAGFGAFTRP